MPWLDLSILNETVTISEEMSKAYTILRVVPAPSGLRIFLLT